MIIFSSLEKKRFSYLTQYRIKLQIGLPQNIGLLGLLWIVGKAKFLARGGLTLFLGMGGISCVSGGGRRLLGGRCLYHKNRKISKETLSLSNEIRIHLNT